VVVVTASACADGRRASPSAGHRLVIRERDFRITAPSHVRAGRVLVQVTNEGPDDHELLIVRWSAGPVGLPLRPDGITINEEALRPAVSLDPAPPGERRTVAVHLRRGRYVIFCNMAGHFMAGMSTVIEVD
jgi:FtsP/CotA-like multicopper oxidase with cupredoxin domain